MGIFMIRMMRFLIYSRPGRFTVGLAMLILLSVVTRAIAQSEDQPAEDAAEVSAPIDAAPAQSADSESEPAVAAEPTTGTDVAAEPTPPSCDIETTQGTQENHQAHAISGPPAPHEEPAEPGIRSMTADHRTFDILKQDFKSGPEVTAACISCHTEASKQIMKTSHWTWICPRAKEEMAERQGLEVGKSAHVINNFCIALGSNEPRCTSCHAGYGWADKTFDFTDETLVDCLVCHDTTGEYRKFPTGAGHPAYEQKEWPPKSGKPWPAVDLAHVAQNVGQPTRVNCGRCHFWGGGGEGVKHGDMDASLLAPDRKIDVHMCPKDKGGKDFNCTVCHTTKDHRIAGRCFTIPAYEKREFQVPGKDPEQNLLACEACHDDHPHKQAKLNDHTDKVACQTCHIPTMARERPTKMWWDWSQAGEKKDGKPISKKETLKGKEVPVYDTKKGAFVWALDEPPAYAWFNGHVTHTFIGDKIDDQTPASELGVVKTAQDQLDLSKPMVRINTLEGSYDDPTSRIWPVKYHRAIQPYDTKNKTLVVPKLFGPKGSGSYWTTYDWGGAIEKGMEYIEQPYSGEFGWIQSEMAWPLSHMVAPEDDALKCDACHAPKGRLENLAGFYMPGRDRSSLLDWLGLIAIAATCVGVVVHGTLRIVTRRKGEA